MRMPPTIPDNECSKLLSNDENLQVFKLLGNRCQSISTTVVQLFCTEPPYHSQWIKRDVGVLCFVKDNIRKNYFFRLFCLRRNAIVWEQEMYNNMEYIESTIFLHTFEGDESMVAFNFASPDEAKYLKNIVDDKIQVRRKRDERRSRQTKDSTLAQKSSISNSPSPLDYKKMPDPVNKSTKRKRNLTKADIGSPLDFKHISHVGWNPTSGFDIDSEDDQLKCFFEKAGISEKQLQDRDTKEFIYDFINKHGGREAVEQATNHHSGRRAPAVPPFAQAPPVPPVPPRGAPRTHTRTAPPPPPPPGLVKSPMAVVNNYEESVIPPPPPPLANFELSSPPMPPPMLDDGFTKAVAAPPPPSLNSALMDSIKSGTTLKHVDVDEKRAPVEDSRNQLLKEIREGMKLKPVCERDVKPITHIAEPKSNDLAEALARALAERSKAIHSEDDDDEEEDSNDDEWED